MDMASRLPDYGYIGLVEKMEKLKGEYLYFLIRRDLK